MDTSVRMSLVLVLSTIFWSVVSCLMIGGVTFWLCLVRTLCLTYKIPFSDLVLFFCFFLCIRYSLNPFFTITSSCLHYIQNTSRANNNLFETRVYNIMSYNHIHLISDSIEINSIMLGYFYHESSVIWQKVS